MRKRIGAVALGLALIGGPAAAQATLDVAVDVPRPYENRYLELRHDYVKRFGLQEAGRNIVVDGFREPDGDVREATRAEVMRSLHRMDAELHPVTEQSAVATTIYSAVGNATVACESGGDYAANTGNGYFGGYQFDSATWDAYGDPAYAEASDAPPAVQDAAAASVPYDAWPSCP